MTKQMQILSLVLFGFFAFVTHAHAQTTTQPLQAETTSVPATETITSQLANWRGILLSIEQALSRSGLSEADLTKRSEDAAAIRLQALKLDSTLSPQLAQIRDQLDELGPAPKDDEPAESEDIRQKREQLEAKFAGIDGNIKAARLIAIRSDQIEQQIIHKRRDRFVTQISKYTTSIFDVTLWTKFFQGLDGITGRFILFVNESVSSTKTEFKKNAYPLPWLLGIAILIIAVTIFARRLLARKSAIIEALKLNDNSDADHFIDIRIGGLFFLKNGILPVAAIYAFNWLIFSSTSLATRLQELFNEFIFIASAIIIAASLLNVFINPANPGRRLAPLDDKSAKHISRVILLAMLLIGFLRLLNKIVIILVSPLEVSIVLSAVSAIVCFVALFMVLTSIATSTNPASDRMTVRKNFIRWGFVNLLLWAAAIIGVISLVTGYIAFAEFLTWQILIASFIFTLLWLVVELMDIHRERFLEIESGRWRHLSKTTGLSRESVLQSAVFGFGLAKLAIIASALVIFLLSWGYRTGDWAGPVTEAFFGFNIGGLSISFSSIVLALLLFFGGFFVTRAIQHWMRNQFLPITSIDPGLRNSITTVLGYAGIVLAALLAITAAGLDLSKVAIVAGALSVGIGFGLQSIVNNFVSGLILLAERPIKSGDWIITSGGEGTVRKTSVRSTEIETFDGATIIIPNSTLITDSVTNWTHHTQKGRIKIIIGVGYDSDPEVVRNILLECAQSHERIVANPAPSVFFQDFGADALIFELRAHLADINNSTSTKSDLRFAILSALRKAEIEIPYPQRDIHIKSSAINHDLQSATPQKTVRKRSAKPKTT